MDFLYSLLFLVLAFIPVFIYCHCVRVAVKHIKPDAKNELIFKITMIPFVLLFIITIVNYIIS